MAYPRFRRARTHKMITRATGTSIVLNSTAIAEVAAATNGPGTGGFDITLPAQVGDVLEWGFGGLYNTEAVTASIDIFTIVSSSRVHSFGNLSASVSTTGPSNWVALNSSYTPIAGSALYVVQSGDIASGSVLCRPYYATSSASNKTLFSTAADQLQMWLKNLGPVAS